MEQSDIITLLIAVIGTLGGAGAWQYYQKKLEIRTNQEEKQRGEQHVYRDDLRERVAILESKLEDERHERPRRGPRQRDGRGQDRPGSDEPAL